MENANYIIQALILVAKTITITKGYSSRTEQGRLL
jgi:hypothetical protein